MIPFTVSKLAPIIRTIAKSSFLVIFFYGIASNLFFKWLILRIAQRSIRLQRWFVYTPKVGFLIGIMK